MRALTILVVAFAQFGCASGSLNAVRVGEECELRIPREYRLVNTDGVESYFRSSPAGYIRVKRSGETSTTGFVREWSAGDVTKFSKFDSHLGKKLVLLISASTTIAIVGPDADRVEALLQGCQSRFFLTP